MSTITSGAATHRGKKRSNNEDAYRVLLGDEAPSGVAAIAVVADGMGGHRAGEVASVMAVDIVLGVLTSRLGNRRSRETDGYARKLAVAIEAANREVHRRAQGDPEMAGMGTTCVVAAVRGRSLYVAHVGDSRAYLLRDGTLTQLTRDHTLLAEQGGDAADAHESGARSPLGHMLTRSVGVDGGVEVDTKRVALTAMDTVLLCSDGLHSMLADDRIAEVLSRAAPRKAAGRLVQLANAAGGHDNVTAVVLLVERVDATANTSPVDTTRNPASSPPSGRIRAILQSLHLPTGRRRRDA